MNKEQQYIAELNKMKTKENAPLIEGIIKGFNEIHNSKEYKQQIIRDSIAQLEAARGTQNPVTFLKTITENVINTADAESRNEAFEGLNHYKKYLVEAFSGTGLYKANLATCLDLLANQANTAYSTDELVNIIDEGISMLNRIRQFITMPTETNDIVGDDDSLTDPSDKPEELFKLTDLTL